MRAEVNSSGRSAPAELVELVPASHPEEKGSESLLYGLNPLSLDRAGHRRGRGNGIGSGVCHVVDLVVVWSLGESARISKVAHH
jgi:hypothetical protein